MNVKKSAFTPSNFVTAYMAYFCGRVVSGPFAGPELRVFGVKKLKAFSKVYFSFLGDSPCYAHQVAIEPEAMDIAFSDGLANHELIEVIEYLLSLKGATREMLGLTFIKTNVKS